MLKQGIHPKIVQERLGHSTITVTLDTYSHMTPGLQEEAAERFDDIIQPQNENTRIVPWPIRDQNKKAPTITSHSRGFFRFRFWWAAEDSNLQPAD